MTTLVRLYADRLDRPTHERARLALCPDCPAPRAGMLEDLVYPESGCRLRCVALSARQPISSQWPASYAFALVRRGAIVRQRVDRHGRATAIDAVGSGAGFLVQDGSAESAPMGFAASASMLCLCPAPVVADSLEQGQHTAADLWKLAQTSLERVERIADARSRNTAMGRIAALLIALSDTFGAKPRTFVPGSLQQRDLAALVAVRHESVCRVLRTMVERSLVRRDDEGIHLLDREGLVSLAN